MREILFRGKSTERNVWLYGNYIHTDCYQKHNDYIGQNRMSNPVVPETVGQYTGLVDINGKKIFEGDIVKHHNNAINFDIYDIGIIYWDGDLFSFRRTSFNANKYGNRSATFELTQSKKYEVIGNIHDNPELMEEK